MHNPKDIKTDEEYEKILSQNLPRKCIGKYHDIEVWIADGKDGTGYTYAAIHGTAFTRDCLTFDIKDWNDEDQMRIAFETTVGIGLSVWLPTLNYETFINLTNFKPTENSDTD